MADWYPYCEDADDRPNRHPKRPGMARSSVVIATDAAVAATPTCSGSPIARLWHSGRLGAISAGGSGDIFRRLLDRELQTWSVEKPAVARSRCIRTTACRWPMFEATVQATEEAIVNAMVAAETVIGASGLRVEADCRKSKGVRALFENCRSRDS